MEMKSKIDNEVNCSICFSDLSKSSDNILHIDRKDYRLNYLGNIQGNKGGNSWVFAMYDAQDESEDAEPIGAIKINKKNFYDEKGNYSRKNNKRIDAEIKALQKCKEKGSQYVIEIDSEGLIKNSICGNTNSYRFYTMEFAKCDLKTYMEEAETLSELDRIKICIELTKSLQELFTLGYYHRDIKPDNFFYLENGTWKIGDLGLVKDRNKGANIDSENEFVGPRGWTSPETMNKYLVKQADRRFDRIIDDKSDIFQLGMVFWYVLQGNAPIGCIMETDLLIKNHPLYILIRQMISYPKGLRPQTFEDIIDKLNQIANNYLK